MTPELSRRVAQAFYAGKATPAEREVLRQAILPAEVKTESDLSDEARTLLLNLEQRDNRINESAENRVVKPDITAAATTTEQRDRAARRAELLAQLADIHTEWALEFGDIDASLDSSAHNVYDDRAQAVINALENLQRSEE